MGWEDIRDMIVLVLGLLGIIAVVCLFVLTPVYFAERSACGDVCAINGDERYYDVFAGGCWCRDDEGLYNPKDSR